MKTSLKGAAIGAGVLGWIAAATLFARRPPPRREIMDINVDHGMADCPWPAGVRDPNAAGADDFKSPDYAGEVLRENAYLVLRDNDRVYLAEPVTEIHCIRAELGPDIFITLDPYLGPLPDDVPPPVDPNAMSVCPNVSAGVTTYRRVRKLLHDMRVTEPFAFDYLEDWYKGNHHGSTVYGPLGPMGKTANAGYGAMLWQCGEPLVYVHVQFFRDVANRNHVCVPGGDGGGVPPIPACPDAGGPL